MTVPEITRTALLVAARAAEEKMAEDIVAFDVAERLGLVRGQLDDESTAAFERNAHDDAPPLLGHLERTIARPRLHGRHARSPS